MRDTADPDRMRATGAPRTPAFGFFRALALVLAVPGLAAWGLVSCEQKSSPTTTPTERPPSLTEVKVEKAPAPVHPDIIALGEDINQGGQNYNPVRKKLLGLPRELSSADAGALLNILLAPQKSNWPELRWAAIVNDGFNILRQGKNPPERFIERLLACHADTSRPAVIRDYALQHFGCQLAAWYRAPEYRSRMLLPDAALRNQIGQTLKAALAPGGGATMGTACNVADDLLEACAQSGRQAPFDLDELAASCRNIVRDPAENLHARLTALGFLGRHDLPSVLPEARQWRDDEQQPVLLRAAAIHYTGQFKEEQDRAALSALSGAPDLRLSYPARLALKNWPAPEPEKNGTDKTSRDS